jgi:hypothetical protein
VIHSSFDDRTVHIRHACRDDVLREINADGSNLFHDFLDGTNASARAT